LTINALLQTVFSAILPTGRGTIIVYNRGSEIISSVYILCLFTLENPSQVTITPQSIKARTAIFTIVVPSTPIETGNSALVEMKVSYRERDEGDCKKKMVELSEGSLDLVDLVPYTRYLLNVTVKNEYLWSDGQQLEFETKQAGKQESKCF